MSTALPVNKKLVGLRILFALFGYLALKSSLGSLSNDFFTGGTSAYYDLFSSVPNLIIGIFSVYFAFHLPKYLNQEKIKYVNVFFLAKVLYVLFAVLVVYVGLVDPTIKIAITVGVVVNLALTYYMYHETKQLTLEQITEPVTI